MPAAVTITRAKEIIECVTLCAGIPVWIWGPAGVGKSTLCRQLAEKHGMLFSDFRLSQIESSDLRGLPDRRNGKTVFLPPASLPDPDEQRPGILFLDELNRARPDVIQAAFQLVLDRCIGEYTLPESWVVLVAGNSGDEYDVRQPDPALISRFCHVVILPSRDYRQEWLRYLYRQAETGAYAPNVVRSIDRFVQNGQETEGALIADSPDSAGIEKAVRACPRTWEMLATVQSRMSPEDIEAYLFDIASGLIGTALAGPYCETVRRATEHLTPEDVLNAATFGHIRTQVSAMLRDEFSALWRSVGTLLKKQAPENDRQKQVILALLHYMVDDPDGTAGVDEATAFIKDLVPDTDENLPQDHPMLAWCRAISSDNALYAKFCRAMNKSDWSQDTAGVSF